MAERDRLRDARSRVARLEALTVSIATPRLVVWSGLDAWRAEVVSLDLTSDGIRANGTQVGVNPLPYRLEYTLDAAENFVTRRLDVTVEGEGWTRRISLTHDGNGGWGCGFETAGRTDLPPAGGDVSAVHGALDCDLGLSPLTNFMPVRRHRLHERPGKTDFLMAWVSVPDLGLHASAQRYEHVRRQADRSVVRFFDLGLHPGFVADLELDADGLVLVYPDLARRVGPADPSEP